MSLAEFILARIEDDARDALAARMTAEAGHGALQYLPMRPYYTEQARQIDAANRVLAECEAKRRLIRWYGDGSDCGDGGQFLELLAQPYHDHPDFDPAWSVT